MSISKSSYLVGLLSFFSKLGLNLFGRVLTNFTCPLSVTRVLLPRTAVIWLPLTFVTLNGAGPNSGFTVVLFCLMRILSPGVFSLDFGRRLLSANVFCCSFYHGIPEFFSFPPTLVQCPYAEFCFYFASE